MLSATYVQPLPNEPVNPMMCGFVEPVPLMAAHTTDRPCRCQRTLRVTGSPRPQLWAKTSPASRSVDRCEDSANRKSGLFVPKGDRVRRPEWKYATSVPHSRKHA